MQKSSVQFFFLTGFLLLLTCMSGLSIELYAQSNSRTSSGSFYSGIGFGIPQDLNSPFSAGMGLTGVSNFNSYSANISNPAHWGLIGYTQGNLKTSLNQYDSSDPTTSSRSANFAIENFQFVFPVLRNRMGASISFSPLVRADFRQRDQDFFNPLPGLSDDIEYIIDKTGSGGINRFEIGIGFRLAERISLGYAFSANVMSLENEILPLFSETQYRISPINQSTEGYSMGHRFGLFAYTGNVFRDNDQFSFGATISLPVSIDAERSITTYRNINNRSVLVELNENSPGRNGTVKLPLEFNSGLTYNLGRFTSVVAELLIQQWDDAEYSFNPTQQGYFKNRVKTGAGLQYHAYRTDQRGGFFSNFKYSLGSTYDAGHLAIDNHAIETVLFHAGIGLMSRRSASSIDLSFHYGIRGTHSSNLVKEDIWGFTLSLNLSELMFLRQRFQ